MSSRIYRGETWRSNSLAAAESTITLGTYAPTESPTESHTPAPTESPTDSPTAVPTESPTESPVQLTDSNFQSAVALWFSDPASAEGTYGHISDWDTSEVTDFVTSNDNYDSIFCGHANYVSWSPSYHLQAQVFNTDIKGWDTSNIITMKLGTRTLHASTGR